MNNNFADFSITDLADCGIPNSGNECCSNNYSATKTMNWLSDPPGIVQFGRGKRFVHAFKRAVLFRFGRHLNSNRSWPPETGKWQN